MGWSIDNSTSAELAAQEALKQALRAEVAADSTIEVIAEAEQVTLDNKTKYLPSVATVALRNSTYPNPSNGDTVKVTGDSSMYRFQTGTGWVKTDEYNPTAIDNVTALLVDMGQQSDSFNGANDNDKFLMLFDTNSPIILKKNKVYEFVSALFVPDNAVIYCNNATFNFRLDGNEKAFVLGNNVRLIGHLNVNVIANTQATGSGEWQAPVLIGNYDNGEGKKNIKIDSLTLTSTRNGGNALMITGNSHNIEIGVVEIPDNSTIGCPVMIHWGGAGNIVGGGKTFHPFNISIKTVKVGKNINTATSGVFLSACHNINIDTISIDEIGGDVVSLFAGDYGYEYADADVKLLACKNINIGNVSCKLGHKNGLIINLKPLMLAVPPYRTNFEIKRFKAIGDGLSTVKHGLNLFNFIGGKIGLVEVSKFDIGGLAQSGVKKLTIEKLTSYENLSTGLSIAHGTDSPEDIIAEELVSYKNGSGTPTNNLKSGAYIGASKRIKIVKSTLGDIAENSQLYGIRVDTTAIDAELESNHVMGVASGGTAYSLGTGTSYGIVKKYLNNTAETGVTLKGGVLHLPYQTSPNGKKIMSGDSSPTAGSWIVGDRVVRETPVIGQPKAWVCTTAGTPGTWTSEGVL